MRLKLDENLPASLADVLRPLGHDVDTSVEEGLAGHPDRDVWNAAQAAGRFFLTRDLDFSDIRAFTPGTHHGLLLIRLSEREQARVHAHVAAWFRGESVERWVGCVVVATERKLRVVSPEPPTRS